MNCDYNYGQLYMQPYLEFAAGCFGLRRVIGQVIGYQQLYSVFNVDSFDRALQTPATLDKDLGLILSCILVRLCQVNPAKASKSPTNVTAAPALIRSTVVVN